MSERRRIQNITLDERTVARRSPDIEHERKVAIFDLIEESSFAPVGDDSGPYNLYLSIEERRLLFDIRSADDTPITIAGLSLTPFRRVVKDYFEVCESYFAAIKAASPSRIEALDMGRRSLHNEGSELLQARLEGKIEADFNTARRLFTLVCVLHLRV